MTLRTPTTAPTTPRMPSVAPTASPLPAPSPLAAHWDLDPSIVFLNHGSFGACPRAVLAAQSRLRAEMEREPVAFFVERLFSLMDTMREALGRFLHCPATDLAPVPNATTGVATVFDNLRLDPGDEILFTEHEYEACRNSAKRCAARWGASVIVAPIPFPIASPDAAFDAVLTQVTPRTRLAMISHVTSPTGLVLPVERLVPELERRGVRTLIDGAHAPGMVPTLDLSTLRPSYYTANCHKWVCSPKGSAFLYVRPDLQAGFRPLALSNNAERPVPGRPQFLTEFDYVGTQDVTPLLAIPDAIREVAALVPGGWPEVMRRNHDLCLVGRRLLCDAIGMEPPAPESMIGSIATMVLPPHPPEMRQRLAARPTRYHDALQDALIARHRVQVPVWGLAGKPDRFLRISAQLYNSIDQYAHLATALKAELAAERT